MGLNLQGFVSLDGSGFERGLARIEAGAERAGETLKGIALSAIGIFGVEQAISKTIEAGEKLVDTSRRLGIGLEDLQKLGFAAQQTGADMDKLTNFIEKLNSARVDPKKFESFTKLGISQPDLSSLKVEDLIAKLSINLRNRSSQDIIAPLRDVGGRGAGDMIVMLKEDLKELGDEAERLGIIVKSEDLLALKFISDEMKILAMVMVGMLAPALVFLMNTVLRIINGLKANFSFYPAFWNNQGGASFRALAKELFSPHLLNQMPPDEMRKHLANVGQGIAEAGAHSAGTLLELNEASDAMIDKLKDMQEKIEEMNRHPTLDIGAASKSPRHAQVYSDSLLRIGNFLGSSSNPVISISQRHLNEARKQTHIQEQIARNTQWRPVVGHGGHGLPPV